MTENASELCAPDLCAPEEIRTPNLLIRSQKRPILGCLAMSTQPHLTCANPLTMSRPDARCFHASCDKSVTTSITVPEDTRDCGPQALTCDQSTTGWTTCPPAMPATRKKHS